jgi:hypothetical protein
MGGRTISQFWERGDTGEGSVFLPVCPRSNEKDHDNAYTTTPLSQSWEMVLPPVGRELVGGTGWG